MRMIQPIRIVMYSHDTFGLGHITRTIRIAWALSSRYRNISILILSGSPVASHFALPPGVDLIKLPCAVKAGDDDYRSRSLDIPFPRLKRLRRELIRSTVETFQPHAFLVDNVPLGMKGEILSTLRYLRSVRPSTRIVLDLRDILDDAGVIRNAWDRDGVPAILDEYYDHIFVLGDPQVYDAVDAYGLPAAKVSYVGYATPTPRRNDEVVGADRSHPRLLLTAGGGGDGFDFLRRMIEIIAPKLDGDPGSKTDGGAAGWRVQVITGPLMAGEERRRIASLADHPRMEFCDFVRDLPERMRRADLVIAMAGYNTCCEILSHAKAALLYPRVTPRVEQLIRAQSFETLGIARMIHPDKVHPDAVVSLITDALAEGSGIDRAVLPRLGGPDRLAAEMGTIVPPLMQNGRGGGSSGASLVVDVGVWMKDRALHPQGPGAAGAHPPRAIQDDRCAGPRGDPL